MLNRELRPQDIIGLASYLGKCYNFTVRNSLEAGEVTLVTAVIEALGYADLADNYRHRFAFTAGNIIYYPGELGKGDLNWQVQMLVHESTHVCQFMGSPAVRKNTTAGQNVLNALFFSWDYFTNTESRAFYEGEAYAAQAEISSMLFGSHAPPNITVASVKEFYGVNEEDLKFLSKYLDIRMRTIDAGGYSSPNALSAMKYFRKEKAIKTKH